MERSRHAHPISIHTPFAGSDWAIGGFQHFVPTISIHTPFAGSDWTVPSSVLSVLFQSTLPLRGVTHD